MRKPVRYTPKVHSFLNAITTHKLDYQHTINLLTYSNLFDYKMTKQLAILLFKYYCTINEGRVRPVNFNTAVSDHIRILTEEV